MNVLPKLFSNRYKIESELGRNRAGGRITWKGTDLKTEKPVVVKQFCFAQGTSSWSGYNAYLQEISILQTLNHDYIPQYLDSIETETGFCLIQEYIAAKSCSNYRLLTLTEVKQVALNILDILVYLQQQNPPILHRDIQPDNILLDESLNAYLIDFGFSSRGSQEISGSSCLKGTPGFIAPEQIIQPTIASDIYSLGISLIYLLVNRDLESLRACVTEDNPYQLQLDLLLPDLERPFRRWLEKMISAKVSQRFPNALAARNSLVKLDSTVKNSSWWLVKNSREQFNFLTERKVLVGNLAIFGMTCLTVKIINFAYLRVEPTTINIAIAILGATAVSISQLAAATIVSTEPQAKAQGIIISLTLPVILAIASAIIWGGDATIIISVAIAAVEILILSYFWWQIPVNKVDTPSHDPVFIKASSWVGAIALGLVCGLNFF